MSMTKEAMLESLGGIGKPRKNSRSGSVFEARMTSPRRALRKGHSLVLRMMKTGRVAKNLARMSKMHEDNTPSKNCNHSNGYVMAVTEFARASGNYEAATALLEKVSPTLTGTKIGVHTMSVCEKIEKTPNVGANLVDTVVLDESDTVAFFFQKADNLNESTLERALAEFGTTVVLAKPGDAIDDSTKSDLYVVALTYPLEKLRDVRVEEEFKFDEETDEPILDESKFLGTDDVNNILRDGAFRDIKQLAAV